MVIPAIAPDESPSAPADSVGRGVLDAVDVAVVSVTSVCVAGVVSAVVALLVLVLVTDVVFATSGVVEAEELVVVED